MQSGSYDLVVVGGGVVGAACAWEATARGLKTLLVDKYDFGSGVSANSYKIVHGGIRYLQHGDVVRLRESSRERRTWLRIAPHLVEPLPVLVPTYGLGRMGKPFLGAGMWLYDLLTLDRNFSAGPHRLNSTRLLGASEVLRQFPVLEPDQLTGGCVFEDGRFYNPTRLVLALVQTAVRHGCDAANYHEALAPVVVRGQVRGLRLKETLSGETREVGTSAIIDATGPWSPELIRRWLGGPAGTQKFSRDAYFVTRRLFDSPYTLAVQGQTRDRDSLFGRPSRHLFISPWRDYTLVGVWHRVTNAPPEAVDCPEEHLSQFLQEYNESFPQLPLDRQDVKWCNFGLVPFEGQGEDGALSFGKRSILIDHETSHGIRGLISIIGLRFTTARLEAERAVNLVLKRKGIRHRASPTSQMRLQGAQFDDMATLTRNIESACWPGQLRPPEAQRLAKAHGSDYVNLVHLCNQDTRLFERVAGSSVLKAEVVWAARHEWVHRLSDVVFRRTELATGEPLEAHQLQAVAAAVGQELDWSAARRAREVDDVLNAFGGFRRTESLATSYSA